MTSLESRLRNWTTVRLDDFCVTSSGGTPSRDNPGFYEIGTIPWVKSGELSQKTVTETSERITAEALENSSAKMVKKGAILVAMYGATVGQIAILGIDAATNQAVCAIEPDQSRCLPRFLYYSLVQKVPELLQMRVGGAQPNISQKLIRDLKFDLPHDLREQAHVVELLDQADALRRQRAEADAKLARLLPALFRHHFGDSARFEKVKLESLGELDRGKSRHRPRNDPSLYGGPYPFVQTGDVTGAASGRITKFSQTYSDAGLAQSRLWPRGTLCITIAANIAETAVLDFDACFPDSVVGFTPNPGISTEYVQSFVDSMREQLAANAPQAAQKNINLDVLRNLEIPLPSSAEQKLFAERATTTRKLLTQAAASAAKLETLFQTLLHRAFTGELTARWREAHLREGVQEMTRLSRA